MNHSFDIDHARIYGLHEAIMIQNLQFWIEKNRANGRHLYDDRTWTYNSVKAFASLFPYLSASAVRRTLNSLQEQGVIVSGNYNASQYDRTTWFAFADEASWLSDSSHLSKTTNAFVKNSKCIVPKRQMDLSNPSNGFVENDNSHTDIKPVVTTDEASASPSASLEGGAGEAPADKPEKPKPAADPALQEACRTTWDAYSSAYAAKYGTQPLRNAKVNSAVKAFVQRVGHEEAPAIAEFFVNRVDDVMVLRGMHDTSLLLKSAEAFRTQWATGKSPATTTRRTPAPENFAARVYVGGKL